MIVIIIILTLHWIGDFVLQTQWQAENKSKNIEALVNHTFTYSTVWLLPAAIWFADIHVYYPAIFVAITFISHTITDYFTSKLNSKLWDKAQFWNNVENIEKYGHYAKQEHSYYVHYFFVSIGFDQLLHYTQLFLTYWLLSSSN